MELARRSFVADMEAGLTFWMVDLTKDPYQIGKVIPLETVLRRTTDLLTILRSTVGSTTFLRSSRAGGEYRRGGLTTTDKYEEFISKLQPELEKRGCPMPTFIVGQIETSPG